MHPRRSSGLSGIVSTAAFLGLIVLAGRVGLVYAARLDLIAAGGLHLLPLLLALIIVNRHEVAR